MLDPKNGLNPCCETKNRAHLAAFIQPCLYLLAGEGVWGRGRHLSPLPQQPFRNLFVVLFVLKKLHCCASSFDLALRLLLEFFRGPIAQPGAHPLPFVILSLKPFYVP